MVRGTLIVILMLGSMAAFLNYFSSLDAYMFTVLPWGAVSLLVAVLVAVFAPRSAFVSRAAVWFSDSMIIFLYIFMPVTILSLLVVLVRNII